MNDELDELRALGLRLGPSQALRVMRRGGGFETMESRSAGMHIDAAMLERHEYLSARRGDAGDGPDDDLARRERELYLLQLQAL